MGVFPDLLDHPSQVLDFDWFRSKEVHPFHGQKYGTDQKKENGHSRKQIKSYYR